MEGGYSLPNHPPPSTGAHAVGCGGREGRREEEKKERESEGMKRREKVEGWWGGGEFGK